AGIPAMVIFDAFWPAASLVLGLACGIASLAPEQAGEQERFFGTLRLPPGRVWFFKAAAWALILMCMLFLLAVGMIAHRIATPESHFGFELGFIRRQPAVFLVLWAVYGFSLGQFFSLLSRRIVVIVALAVLASATLLGLWLPS